MCLCVMTVNGVCYCECDCVNIDVNVGDCAAMKGPFTAWEGVRFFQSDRLIFVQASRCLNCLCVY